MYHSSPLGARAVSAYLCLVATTLALPTWPDKHDSFEQTMFVNSGYGKQPFLDFISPCSFSDEGQGRINAAEWIRTAYHDMATADVLAGTGGLDASLLFEVDRAENIGPALNHTFGFLAGFHNSRTSVSDLLALAVYAAVRNCGGPLLTIRAGRVDATEAGPKGVPEPQDDLVTITDKFARQGFNTSDMIGLVACGHTLGGVHGGDFPTIVPGNGTAGNNFSHFDTTVQFDNLVATEYISGNTSNPLVVGADPVRNSDLRVFSADGNVTMKALTDPALFRDRCASLLTRMIETVPAATVLTDPLQAYDIKPGSLDLDLSTDGSNITFTGNIRVRVTDRPAELISSVDLLYLDHDGASGNISTTPGTWQQGMGFGLTDSFMHYEISTVLPAATAIHSFNVTVTLTNGTVESYNNNGVGYPVSSTIMLSSTRSCLGSNDPYNMTVAAAVRGTVAPGEVQIVYSVPVQRIGVAVPLIQTLNATLSLSSTLGNFSIYSVDVPLAAGQGLAATIDLVARTGESQAIDYFRSTQSFGECT